MEPSHPDRANRLPWPPIIYVVALAAGFALDKLFPLNAQVFDGWQTLGWLIAVSGVAVAVAGLAQFQATGTPFDPTAPAKALATGGIYQWTRNPMYLGGVIFFAGFGLAMLSGWLLVAVPAIAIALQKLAIEPEEAYLTRRFAAAYTDYCKQVRRWV